MDLKAIVAAKNIDEVRELAKEAIESTKVVKSPKRSDPVFVDRKFDLIVRKNGEIAKHHKGLTATVAGRWRNEYRKDGYRVDQIETETVISATNKVLEFTEKNYVPALEGRIPATCEMSEQRANQKRIDAHSNMIKKMARNHTAKETVEENIKIYEKVSAPKIERVVELFAMMKIAHNATLVNAIAELIKKVSPYNNLIFNGNYEATVKFFLNHPDFKITEHTVYVPSKVWDKLKKMERAG